MRCTYLVSLLCLILLVGGCSGSSPSGTVVKFYDLVERGEADEAMELLSGSMAQSLGAEKIQAGLRQAAREMSEKGGVDEFKIVEEKVLGEIAEVRAEIKYGNGTVENEKVQLVKEGGRWKIQFSK
jgi:Domain of unknown function (DUF4878)